LTDKKSFITSTSGRPESGSSGSAAGTERHQDADHQGRRIQDRRGYQGFDGWFGKKLTGAEFFKFHFSGRIGAMLRSYFRLALPDKGFSVRILLFDFKKLKSKYEFVKVIR
jgi:hypothetical protein